ncbi:MAG: 50S ribosomal protein L10 [Sandaracinaceae bacterium]
MGAREDKAAVVEQVKSHFEKATSTVLVDFAGIDVPTITELRNRFREAGVEYRVVKNNLIRQALRGTDLDGNEDLDKSLVGMTGVAWSFEDPSAAAKIIKSFRKEDPENEKLEVKAGILETVVMDAERVENQLATMPGKDELRAMLLAQLQAPAQNLVRQLMAPLQSLVYALDARRTQLEEGEG